MSTIITCHAPASRDGYRTLPSPIWVEPGAATGWADTDPAAAHAADRVEDRLRVIDPNSMRRYDQARASQADRLIAMRDVFAQRTGDDSSAGERRIFVGDPPRTANFSTTNASRTAADIATESYPARYTTVPKQQPIPAAESHPNQTASKTRTLSR